MQSRVGLFDQWNWSHLARTVPQSRSIVMSSMFDSGTAAKERREGTVAQTRGSESIESFVESFFSRKVSFIPISWKYVDLEAGQGLEGRCQTRREDLKLCPKGGTDETPECKQDLRDTGGLIRGEH